MILMVGGIAVSCGKKSNSNPETDSTDSTGSSSGGGGGGGRGSTYQPATSVAAGTNADGKGEIKLVAGPASPIKSVLSLAGEAAVAGQALTIKLTVKDGFGNTKTVGGDKVLIKVSTGTSTGVLSKVSDNGDGTYSATFTADQVGTPVTLGVSLNDQPLAGDIRPIPVLPGPIDLNQSKVDVSNTALTSGATAMISLTARDSRGNRLAKGGEIVTFKLSGGSSTGTVSDSVDHHDGTYTATVVAKTAGSPAAVTTAIGSRVLTSAAPQVSVLAGPASLAESTVSVSATSIVSGSTLTLSLTTRDGQRNPLSSGGLTVAFTAVGGSSTGTISGVTDHLDGTYTATYNGVLAGSPQAFKATIGGQSVTSASPTANVTRGPLSLAQSQIALSASSVASGSFVTATVTPRDAAGNQLGAGLNVAVTATGGSSTVTISAVTDQQDGTYTCMLTGVLKGSPKVINASIGGGAVTSTLPSLTVTQGPWSPQMSQITASATSLMAGDSAVVTVTARDGAGNQFATGGQIVALSAVGGTSIGDFDDVIDNGDGTYTSIFTGYGAGSANQITATIDDNSVTSAGPSIKVNPGSYDLTESFMQVSSAVVTSGDTAVLTLVTRDAYDNLLTSGGASVAFTVGSGAGNGNIGAVVDHQNGTYTATFTATTAGANTLMQATLGGNPLLSALPTISVLTGPASVVGSTLTVSAATIQSGDTATITLTTKDLNGNRVTSGGLSIAFSTVGGTSTGTIAAVTDAGDGSYSALFTAAGAGSATEVHAQIAGAELSTGWPSITVTPSSLIQYRITGYPSATRAGDAATFTVQVEDHNHNGITNYTGIVAFSSTDLQANLPANYSFRPSDGGIHTFSATLRTSGVHTITGTDTSIGALTGSQTDITVATAAPSKLAFVGPVSGKAGICNPALLLTLQDPYGNMVNAASTDLAINLAGSGSGDYYSDADCSSRITTTAIAAGSFSRTIYLKDPKVESLILSAADQAAQLSAASTGYAVKPYQAWIGASASPSPFATGSFPSRGRMDGMLQGPIGVAFDSDQYLYVADSSNGRMVKYDGKNNYAFVGWVGKVAVTPTGGDFGCTTTAVNQVTPGWCTGGYAVSGTGQGSLNAPQSVYLSGTNLYVVDTSNHRVVRYDAKSGVQTGWIGKILTSPTGGVPGCNGAAIGGSTPGWCTGGTSTSGNKDGQLSTPRAVNGDGTYIYVADGANHRISRYVLSTGVFAGWIGNISTMATGGAAGCDSAAIGTSTPGWCFGGSSKVGNGTGMFSTPRGLSIDSTYLYVADSGNFRMQKVAMNTGAAAGWIGRVSSVPTGGMAGCTATAVNSATPGWCLGGTAKSGTGDNQFSAIYGAYVSGGFLYTVDASAARINKHLAATGAYAGWVGRVLSSPSGGAAECATAAINAQTPGWCTGGTSASGANDGMLNGPALIDGDGTYLYVSDTANNRISRYSSDTGITNGWLGARGDSSNGWANSSQATLLSSRDDQGFYLATGLAFMGNDLFAVDSTNHRLKRYNMGTGLYSGWLGNIWTPPSGGVAGCTSAAIGTLTPGWCTGGNAKAGNANGMLNTPQGIYADTMYVYVADSTNHRISKYDGASGSFAGWIGNVSSTPTSGAGGCASTSAGSATPGWCLGGTSKSGSNTGALNAPQGLDSDGTYLYVIDGSNHRIVKYQKATGAVVGWIGKIATAPTGGDAGCAGAAAGSFTPGWCTGGTAASGSGNGHLSSPKDISVQGTSLYVTDANHRISRFAISSGAFTGWIGKIASSPTGGDIGCVSAAVGSFTPGWCSGGTATSGTGSGHLSSPKGIWSNGTNIYVADVGNNRISKYLQASGAFVGWFGAVATVPTGGDSGCSAAGVATLTPGWCSGGTAKRGSDLGMFDAPAYVKGSGADYLYISDGNNDRITRIPQ